jgi:predicted transcriptional regulator
VIIEVEQGGGAKIVTIDISEQVPVVKLVANNVRFTLGSLAHFDASNIETLATATTAIASATKIAYFSFHDGKTHG